MSANTITQTGTLFPEQLVTELINKVNGHSTLAKLSAQTPQPFTGEKEMVFTMDDEAEIVGEGEAKNAADAKFTEKVIKPIKFVYQHRVSDEFKYASEERRIRYLQAFADGFAKKIARGFDIAAFHGINPRNKAAASFRGTNSFYGLLTGGSVIAFDPDTPDENLQDAIDALVGADEDVSGIAMAPAFAAAMGKVQNGISEYRYPEFRFGGRPNSFAGLACDTNSTVPFAPQTVDSDVLTTMAVVGDFAGSFRWGYSEKIPLEVIEYGDPDGTGRDLKRYNEVCLRAEAYIGWAILFPEAFALIRKTDEQ
jgi:HK97 family phage major capsid protein